MTRKLPAVIIFTLSVPVAVGLLIPSLSSLQERRISAPQRVRLNKIPATAEIVYLYPANDNPSPLLPANGPFHIFTTDRRGANVTQITFEQPRNFEHVAVSYDRRYVIANDQLPNPTGHAGGFSRLWLFDLEQGTEARLVPEFVTAGNGGVAWDPLGFIYFAASEKDPFPRPKSKAEFMANAGANDIYKIKLDGTGLQRLVNTPTRAESDVSVSFDGTLVISGAFVLDPLAGHDSEIEVLGADGSNLRVVYKGGKPGVASVHDPEISPNNQRVIFSKVNSTVRPNFRRHINTAHDLWVVNMDGTGLTRLTKPGPVSIIPNWQLPGDLIVFTEINEAEQYSGIAIISSTGGADQTPERIKFGASQPKFIPQPGLRAGDGQSSPRGAVSGQESPRSIEARIRAKMARFDKLLPQWAAAGGRHEVIAPFGREFDAYMKAGKVAEAERVIDQLLDIVSTGPAQRSR